MSIGLLFKRISNQLEADKNEDLRRDNLTSAQLEFMILLDARQGLTTSQKDIGEFFGIKHTTTINILKRLEEKQLVYREINSENARYRDVYLTEEGKQKISRVRKKREKMDERMLGKMNERDRDELLRLLNEVYSNLRESGLQQEEPTKNEG